MEPQTNVNAKGKKTAQRGIVVGRVCSHARSYNKEKQVYSCSSSAGSSERMKGGVGTTRTVVRVKEREDGRTTD